MTIFEKAMSQSCRAPLSLDQGKALLLVFFGIMTVAVTILSGGKGVFINDEGTYHLMAKNFAESASLAIWNGYEEFATKALMLPHTIISDGRLVPHYPYFFAVLASPFYLLAGFKGLFILNAIAYVAMTVLCHRIATKLFQDSGLALNACLILVFATFSWEYSQAAWPHAVAMLFVTASVYLVVLGVVADNGWKSSALALGAGLIAGFGAGLRLDVAFVFPTLIVPFLFVRRWRPWCVIAVCVGAAPGVLALAATNFAKFGTVSAFAYSQEASGGAADSRSYLPIVIIGLTILVAAWFVSRNRTLNLAPAQSPKSRWVIVVVMVLLGSVVLIEPNYRNLVVRIADGTYQLLVDLRIRDLEYSRGGLTRGPGGALIYIGSVKKALFQSCPYLTVLVLPGLLLLRNTRYGLALGTLFMVPASYVAPYAFFAWDGGLNLNLRYFLPIFPFTSILVAFAWREVTKGLDQQSYRLAAIAALLTAVLYLAIVVVGLEILWAPPTARQQELVFLSLPLVLAGCVLLLTFVHVARPGAVPRGLLPTALAIGFVWSGLVAFTHDFPRVFAYRNGQAEAARTIANTIEKDSLVITLGPHYFSALPDDMQVRIALPQWDDFESFHPLVDFHLEQNHAVYLWVNELMEKEIQKRRLLETYATTSSRDFPWGHLVQLHNPR